MAKDPLKIDPTRSLTLRKRFVQDINGRMRKISAAITDLIVEKDAFGLKKDAKTTRIQMNVDPGEYAFQTNPQKLESFRRWIKKQVDDNLLEVSGTGEPWTAEYIDSARRKGIVRGYTQVHKTELASSDDFYRGGKEQFLKDAFNAPETTRKLQLVYARNLEDLRGISSDLSTKLTRQLADGLAHGDDPYKIARGMRKTSQKISNTRAKVLARTEVINAHAEGQLDGFEKLGIEDVKGKAEWMTAGDNRVCPICADLAGSVYKVSEARGLIPRHPNCRCMWVPYLGGKNKNKFF